MNLDDKKRRIEELIETLNEASAAYYDEASEIMSNYEYDALYDELESLEKETGYTPLNSPTKNVGYTVQSELPKERHRSRMLSLDKTKSREELAAWLGNHEGLLSWKLDGLTVVLTYEGGELVKAVTRGNGDIGEVITPNARVFVNVPKHIPYKGHAVIRGEAVITYEEFDRINEAIDDADAKYKNPRNLCSGSVRQLNSKITAERNVRFYAFTLSEADGVDYEGLRSNQMKWMAEQGFDVVEYVKVDNKSIYEAIDNYAERVHSFEIPSDGLVLTLEDLEYAATLGTTAKFPRDSLAFKWADQQAETILREIEWSPSRTGLLNPIAIFDPVELEGTTVKRASVHNLNIMETLKLGIGDTITVYKANMIIPQIGDNLTKSGNIELPSHCPVCDGTTEIKLMTGTKVLTCTNPNCLAKQVKRFSLFVSRDALNIEGLSEQTLLKFIGFGYIKSFADIFRLENHRDEIVELDGFGKKSYDKLSSSIEKARHTVPTRILVALGIPGVGVTTAAQIARACENKWAKISSLSYDELIAISGIGEVMARDYESFFADEHNKSVVLDLVGELDIDESYEKAGEALSGEIFVITGSLEHYKSRTELKKEIEAQGGKVAGSVSKNTSYLVTNNPESGSSKNKAAAELGVKIITEDEIRSMLGY
ncbi:MAG: NAD-dependent DNA ligase LigA [Mogibacterium diversum]|uniref:NAD-dependent DNA ligase LigA n=1 Tax=Mogibacterium diversum TaxID=114527 RepID=UPI002050896A|nr:NAD-dependent DNA ligase LigA [Mogibacterium diversum]UQF81695.1 MAG: NAD-dependent DNA ligase LigA [Mogibacterium diversum]